VHLPSGASEVTQSPPVFRSRLLLLVYIGVGLVIASTHHYFSNVHGWRGVVSAVLAVFLWPLILLGINLHIRK
jgi:hypothetical protein